MGFLFLLSIILPCTFPRICAAHREDYIDETLVFLTLERASFEPEYWFDAGRETDAHRNLIRHSLAAEYGITEHLMMDGRVSFKQETSDPLRFESGRFESRYRFGEEGERPVDLAISGEINVARSISGENEYGLEPRLIFSKDFADLNLTVNLPLEISLNNGAATLAPAFGIRYDASELFRMGSEIKYDTDHHAGAVIPQIWLGLSKSLTLKAGYSQDFAQNRERFFRLALEAEL